MWKRLQRNAPAMLAASGSLERVLVEVVHNTEQVRVICHWHGGNRTSHELMRPVARLTTLSTYSSLVARAADHGWSNHK
jgi:hypothetical protein